jgi:hypothetical protein
MKGQDIIHKTDTTTIRAKVLEVGEKEIKFLKFDNLDGPVYLLKKKHVSSIDYQNGTNETFGKGDLKYFSDFKKNIVSFNMIDLMLEKVTFSYEHLFSKGFISLTIPLSIGYSSSIKKSYLTGFDLNYFPKGQGQFNFFFGPKFRYGNYGQYGFGDPCYVVLFNGGIEIYPSYKIRFLCGLGLGAVNSPGRYRYYQSEAERQINLFGSLDFNIGFCF